MALDESTLLTQLTAIQAAITAALTNPRPDWQVGQVKMNQSAYLKTLIEQQNNLIEQINKIPKESIDTSQDAVTPFGQDVTDYKGEDWT